MNTTSLSLLFQLKNPHQNKEASWRRFVDIYTPLLFQWSARLDVPVDDRHDLVQNTFAKLLSSINSYDLDSPSRFRGWLLTVLRNTWVDTQRKRSHVLIKQENFDLEATDPMLANIDAEYRQYLLTRVSELILKDFPQTTRLVFQRYVMEEQSASDVASEFGITVNAVYLIRSRVLRRIRDELSGLLD